ncbi:MAG: hypothetical protein KAS32_11530 [Candidatus Peribacteraceae bacterium]|nr:hypothetical protein [Candidatus Peribacteraceae bacterium]
MSIDSFGVRKYYVFKYVVDAVSGEPTEHAGEIVAFVDAETSFDALEKAGFDDFNTHGANLVDKVEDFEKAIKDERKLLKKLSSDLKVWRDAEQAEREQFLKDRPCPNGCGKMDEKLRCDKCGFGREAEEVLPELDKLIKSEKKKGNDVSELEKIRDAIKKDLEI